MQSSVSVNFERKHRKLREASFIVLAVERNVKRLERERSIREGRKAKKFLTTVELH